MIAKITSSGKGFMIVDDDGNTFMQSVEFIKGLLDGRSPSGFVLFSRMPWKASKTRFAPSPVFNPKTGEKELLNDEELTTNNDGLSVKSREGFTVEKEFNKDVKL